MKIVKLIEKNNFRYSKTIESLDKNVSFIKNNFIGIL